MDTAFDDWVKTYGRDCPSRTVIDVLANKWALYVLGALRRFDRPLRFNELRRLLDGVTQKMLTQTLRTLERDGLVTRTLYPAVPVRVEYAHPTGRRSRSPHDRHRRMVRHPRPPNSRLPR